MPAGLLRPAPAGWRPAGFSDLDAWNAAADILFVRLDTLGDVLMTTPAMRAFKERDRAGAGRGAGAEDHRGAGSRRRPTTITLLTSPVGAGVAPYIPEIDEVIRYEAPWMKATPQRSDSLPEHTMIAELKRRRFDAAVIPTVYSQNPLPPALLCYLADIPLRAAHCRENPYQLLTHWLKDPEPDILVRHEVRRQLDLAAALGAVPADERLSFQVQDRARKRAGDLLRASGLEPGRPWILAHPGATASSRRYPPERFAKALRLIEKRTGARVVVSGDQADRGVVAVVVAQLADLKPVSLAGITDLETLAAVIEAATLLVANNTGPVHIAAAVGTPVVDLYALTNPQHTPWQVPNRVLYADVPCRICYKSVCPEGHQRCLRDVPPEAVADAAAELLAGNLLIGAGPA